MPCRFRPFLRPLLWAGATWLVVFAAGAPGEMGATRIVGIRWSAYDNLRELAADPLIDVRYVNGDVAILQVQGGASHPPALFVDDAGPGEGWFLVDHLHGHGPAPGVRLVWLDAAGWALVRLVNDELPRALESEHFLYPLPPHFELTAPQPRAARALQRDPSPGVQALLDEVDADRLRQDVETLSLFDPAAGAVAGNVRTRYARRPETFESTEYLMQQLSAAIPGGRVWLDTFRIMPGDTLMYNVVAELPGSDPDAGYWIVCAHYDAIGSRSRASQMAAIGETDPAWHWWEHPAPGADDNGSGVALVLETARALGSAPRAPWSVRFIAWSGEELGLWGSRHYADVARQADDHILGVLNYDMIGFNDLADRIELVSNPASTWIVDHLQATNERYGIGLDVDVLEDPFAGLSDHAPFWARGYDAILGIENYLPTDSSHVSVETGRYRINSQYHTVVDLPDSIRWELVADVTRLTVAALAQFAQEEGLPNLALFDGDVTGIDEDLRVDVTNLGVADVTEPFSLRVSRCDADSAACRVVYDEPVTDAVPAGGMLRVTVPWERFGDTVLLIEIDADNAIVEEDDADNRAFQRLRLVPTKGLVVYPNPFRISDHEAVHFSGLPLFSRVRILAASGELVWEGREEDQGDLTGEILWTGTNASGFAAASGVYVYIASTFEGEMIRRGKIAVVR